MKLRELLDKHSSVSGLCSEEKDPEELLNCLLTQIMRAEPFLKVICYAMDTKELIWTEKSNPFQLNSGQDAYYYQLFVDKDERLSFPSVQQLFEQSFYASDIKLKEVPSCLIIQMPRFGKTFKMYPRIFPSQVLDVTDIIEDCKTIWYWFSFLFTKVFDVTFLFVDNLFLLNENYKFCILFVSFCVSAPRQCTVCGKLAKFECRDCFGILQNGIGLESTSFCSACITTVHMHAKR